MIIPLQWWGLPKENFDKIWQQFSKLSPTVTTARTAPPSTGYEQASFAGSPKPSNLPVFASSIARLEHGVKHGLQSWQSMQVVSASCSFLLQELKR